MPEDDPHSPLGQTMISILAWLAAHGPATAAEVAQACEMEEASVRGRLVMLDRQGLLSARSNGAPRSRLAYNVTAEGRRKAGITGARMLGA